MAESPITRARIEQEVREALATTLRVDGAAIDLDKPIVTDLGATSIDFLDINFKLETTFGVQLATQLLLDHVEEELGEGVALDRDSRITEPAATLLRKHLGENDRIKAGMFGDEVPALVTPRVLIDSVEAILGHLPDACPACGASQWTAADETKVVCGACQAEATYPDGDELTRQWIQKIQADEALFPTA